LGSKKEVAVAVPINRVAWTNNLTQTDSVALQKLLDVYWQAGLYDEKPDANSILLES